jgi:hypothetical protein
MYIHKYVYIFIHIYRLNQISYIYICIYIYRLNQTIGQRPAAPSGLLSGAQHSRGVASKVCVVDITKVCGENITKLCLSVVNILEH